MGRGPRIGADETLPAEAVQAVYMGFQRMPEPMLRSSGMFGPAIEVADDASEQAGCPPSPAANPDPDQHGRREHRQGT